MTQPKFGISRSGYLFDKDKKVIAKGLTSIKYMNKNIADQLYKLSKDIPLNNTTYKYSFIDLLIDINNKTNLNSRQLDILIRIDFFSDFGNQRELLKIVEYFDKFKGGEAKQIKKALVEGTEIEDVVKKYSVGVTKSGGEAKSYTLLDVIAILKEIEELILKSGVKDVDDIVKIKQWFDVTGEVGFITGKSEDRRKLFVEEIKAIRRKSDRNHFGYGIKTKSLGSGKESYFTVFKNLYTKSPFDVGDIIYCTDYRRDGKYFTLTGYKKL